MNIYTLVLFYLFEVVPIYQCIFKRMMISWNSLALGKDLQVKNNKHTVFWTIWEPKKHVSTNVKSSKRLRSHATANRIASLYKMLWTRNLGRVVKTETWQQKKGENQRGHCGRRYLVCGITWKLAISPFACGCVCGMCLRHVFARVHKVGSNFIGLQGIAS